VLLSFFSETGSTFLLSHACQNPDPSRPLGVPLTTICLFTVQFCIIRIT